MPTLFSPNTLAFNGAELKSSAEAVFESAFSNPEMNNFLTIVSGIKAKTQIAILGRFNGLLGGGDGLCDTAGRTITTSMAQKLWDPATVSDKVKYCWKDIKGTFWIWGTKNGIDKADLTSLDFLLYIEELFKTELIETWMRIAYFNDTDAALTTAAPAGVITVGTDLNFFNKIDGIFKQLFAITAADTERKTLGIDSRNGQATYASQKFTVADRDNLVVSTTIGNMESDADSRLVEKTNLVYACTKSVYDQYKKELKFANIAFTTERLENGIEQLNCGGISVQRIEFWDRMIKAYQDNGTKYFLPHRVLLTHPDNIQVGTEEETTLTDYKVWFSEDTDNVFVKFQFDIDAKVIEDHMVQFAY